MSPNLPPLTVLLSAPRGFCAGVDRAVKIVEEALARFGAPVYVRHEIVHNRFVVDRLRAMGAVFVEELDAIPDDGQPVVFSAHGVPKRVPQAAQARELFWLDATCPLVSKVHREVERHFAAGRQIVLIGHRGHPEVEGTMGQVPEGAVLLVETESDVDALCVQDPSSLAYCTQTTLSVDEAAAMIAVLKARFPEIVGPSREDICYATTNRQAAVKQIAPQVDVFLVIGAPNSSNSRRLAEVAEGAGCPRSFLIQRAADLDFSLFSGVSRVGLTAGASAPEVLVEEVLAALRQRFSVSVEEVRVAEETIVFNLPRALRDDVAAAG